MDPFKQSTAMIERAVADLDLRDVEGQAPDLTRVTVEPPRDPAHGDVASNVAMVLAKPLRAKPRDVAQSIADRLAAHEVVADISVAGPGFVNITFEPNFWTDVLGSICDDADWGRGDLGESSKVNVEYVSANPTGPMHVGHCRGAVVGDALANLLEAVGYDVTREYYVNDAGAQIDVLARSVHVRYRQALGEEVGSIPPGLYPGDYLVPLGEALAQEFGERFATTPEMDWLPLFRARAIDGMLALIREDLDALGVRHDVFFSERTLQATDEDGRSSIDRVVERLASQGHVYRGTLPPPKGEVPDDWEDREQTLFRSTAVGDDTDRALAKSDGTHTYFAADVAYLADKIARGFPWTVFVLGADHGGYVRRMQALARALAGDELRLTIILTQLVRLFRDGELVRMSKRSGDLVTLREVVDEVGRDAVRFMMLYRKADAPLDFDFRKVTEQSKDNPVFYVQYAHARCCSVLRQADEALPGAKADPAQASRLSDPTELALIRKLAAYPRTLQQAAEALEPHRIAFYLYELASAFHAHWNFGRDREDLRFVKADDPKLTGARLALVEAVRRTLASGLGIVGVGSPSEMR